MIVGVDVGTSMTKADAYDDHGRKLASAERASRLVRFDDGRVEQDLEDVVGSVADVVRRVVADGGRNDPSGRVRALALTGQGDGLWLRDADGYAARPPISWLDDRAADVVRRWQDDGTVHEVYRRTGSGLFPGCHAPLLVALGRDEPESLENAAVAGYCVDALVQRLTGEITVDASDASLPFLDVTTRTYDDAALAACGLTGRRDLLADPAPAGTVHALDARGAELTGLPVGTPVTGGPFDLPACAVGAGLSQPGDGLLIIGTTLACEVFTDRVDPEDGVGGTGLEPAGMWLCTPEPDRWLRAMPAMVGTAGLDWLLDFLGVGIDALGGLLDGTRPGAGGVSALPFLSASGERAPFVDTRARGQVEGITLSTRRGDVVRAVCEGIAYTARHCFERAATSADREGRLVACGGGSRSGPWAQVFADVLERPLVVPDDPGLGTRGAAVTAARALGDDLDPAAWAAPSRTVEPAPGSRHCYDEGYARYRAHVDTARDFWARQARGFARPAGSVA